MMVCKMVTFGLAPEFARSCQRTSLRDGRESRLGLREI